MGCVFFFCILVVAFVGVVSFSTPRTLGGQGYPSELVGIRERLAGALQRETRSLRGLGGTGSLRSTQEVGSSFRQL